MRPLPCGCCRACISFCRRSSVSVLAAISPAACAARSGPGRILLTSSGHDGVSTDDRAYLVQLVASTTGLSPADAERRVDTGIANAKTALNRSRRSTIILAFSLATALLLGAVAAWAAACAGGRHRDGAPLPEWMVHSDRLARRRIVGQ